MKDPRYMYEFGGFSYAQDLKVDKTVKTYVSNYPGTGITTICPYDAMGNELPVIRYQGNITGISEYNGYLYMTEITGDWPPSQVLKDSY